MVKKKTGMMFVLSSPSGAGKTTLTKKIAKENSNFIIANSTFSLLAAHLGKKRNSIITYPEPWFKFRNYNKNYKT